MDKGLLFEVTWNIIDTTTATYALSLRNTVLLCGSFVCYKDQDSLMMHIEQAEFYEAVFVKSRDAIVFKQMMEYIPKLKEEFKKRIQSGNVNLVRHVNKKRKI